MNKVFITDKDVIGYKPKQGTLLAQCKGVPWGPISTIWHVDSVTDTANNGWEAILSKETQNNGEHHT